MRKLITLAALFIAPPALAAPATITSPHMTATINDAGAMSSLKVDGVEVVAVGFYVEGSLTGYTIGGSQGNARQRVYIVTDPSRNFYTMPGANLANVWTGSNGKVKIIQTITPTATGLHFDVTLTNVSGLPMTAVRYRRLIDANPSESALNTLTVNARGAVSAWAKGKVRYTSTDPRASFFVADRLDPRDAYLPVKTNVTGRFDCPIGVQINVGELAVGQTVSFGFDLSGG